MAEGTLRVAQLNAGSLLEPGWDERREVLVMWLEHLAPDIVCLQEVWRDGAGADTAAWIVDHLGVTDWYWRFGGDAFAPGCGPTRRSRSDRRSCPAGRSTPTPTTGCR